MEPILSTYRHGSVSARVKLTKFLPWVTNKSQEAADQKVIAQGQILAEAMGKKLDEVISAMVSPPVSHAALLEHSVVPSLSSACSCQFSN